MVVKKTKQQWSRILYVYGLTEKDYKSYDLGYCPLCLRKWSVNVVPCVDHDHKTGFVRGLLCRYCNRYVLGRLSDMDIASRIKDYLTNQPMKHKVPPKKRKKKRKTKRQRI